MRDEYCLILWTVIIYILFFLLDLNIKKTTSQMLFYIVFIEMTNLKLCFHKYKRLWSNVNKTIYTPFQICWKAKDTQKIYLIYLGVTDDSDSASVWRESRGCVVLQGLRAKTAKPFWWTVQWIAQTTAEGCLVQQVDSAHLTTKNI